MSEQHTPAGNEDVPVNRQRSLVEYLWVAASGFAMGSADVVPGVSGGTMAFILGIYEELINSIKAFTSPAAIRMVLTLKWADAFRTLPWRFLLALGLGLMTAVFTLAQVLEWTLVNHPVYLWSFFFGLVLSSVFVVSRRVEQWNAATFAGLTIAAIAAYVVVGLVPVQTPNAWWFLLLSGAIAVCALILPGISGAFILVLLGKYQYVLAAVNDRDFLTLALVAFGGVIGLVTFAQVISFLFKRYRNVTIAVLIGLMLGSLRKIWPWKEVVEWMTDSHGELVPLIERNIAPVFDQTLIFAVLLAIVGFVVVFSLETFANRSKSGETQQA